jgi:hypothetical protein
MSTDDDLDAQLRAFFTETDLDVDVAPTLPGQVLAGARRAQRRSHQVRAVTAVAAVAAAGGAVVTLNQGGLGGDAVVRPAGPPVTDPPATRPITAGDPRCQEYWAAPTPGVDPGYTGGPFDVPTYTGGPEGPINPGSDPFSTWAPEWEGRQPYPQRGPHGGVLCTVVDGKAMVMTQEGFEWPRDEPLPTPTFEMFPGETPGQWNRWAPFNTEPPSQEEIERHERASATIWTFGPDAPTGPPDTPDPDATGEPGVRTITPTAPTGSPVPPATP